jgi:hypothetical protein
VLGSVTLAVARKASIPLFIVPTTVVARTQDGDPKDAEVKAGSQA